MNRRCRWLVSKVKSFAIFFAAASVLYLTHQFIFSKGDLIKASPPLQATLTTSPFSSAKQFDEVIASTRPSLSPQIETYTSAGKFELAKDELLDRALQAAGASDNGALAFTLGELGELALQQAELDMAEVYLTEALELYEELGDEISVAGVYVQMGRLHLYSRHRARKSSDAYDQLLIARWMISQDRFQEAEGQLKQVVETNLQLHRYGAAASAYKTLFSGYRSSSNIMAAEHVGKEAIKLHAGSGNLRAANRLLNEMLQTGLSQSDADAISREIEIYHQSYEDSVQAIGAARDYAQLYNQLSSRGDALQAWRFRQRAQRSLSEVSKRARYRRQPDVVVELYKSNARMDSALKALQKAAAVYDRYGLQEGVEVSRKIRAQIY